MIIFCTQCKTKYKVDLSKINKNKAFAYCKKCNHKIVVQRFNQRMDSNNNIHSYVYSNVPINHNIQVGELITVANVYATNVQHDIIESLKNILGGKMKRYSALIQKALDESIKNITDKAVNLGYDGIVGLKVSTPMVVEGGVEIIVYGNGFEFIDKNK